VDDVAFNGDGRAANSMPQFVARAAGRSTEVDPRNAGRNACGSVAGRERDEIDPGRRECLQERAFVAADPAGNRLEQLAGVKCDSHRSRLMVSPARGSTIVRARADVFPRERADLIMTARDQLCARGFVGECLFERGGERCARRWAR
jgi:hypothetical protein